MANKYYEQHQDRTPLSDVGMTVALAVTIVTLIKLLMYGLTFVSLSWLFITLLYILSTTISNPKSSVRKSITIIYLLISFVAIYAAFVYDKPVLPKTESHMKADVEDEEQNNNNENNNNDDVVIVTPKPVTVETDNIVQEDESTSEETGVSSTEDNYNVGSLEDDNSNDANPEGINNNVNNEIISNESDASGHLENFDE